ncbi:nitrogenase molybdenum-iron protein beta chain [Clostridium acidisoli DSM 12555]|uniref:Nitrogenase molybdenum-iron protein beta chain n=1 Tax=Clostridium acidisoli DSM 12555 TaxID=1121291 RepID=A0A1W1XNR4_9CLOT|nr:nitrogenase component 1 [Clostridium acidisoli]SMC25161.1 nitrogenase molybdenum-iron protein beta chain [Clostridium acidisoli DSM 12555]
MSEVVQEPRHVCALGGFESVLAIERAVPIIHSGPGCAAKLWATLGVHNGCQGTGYIGGHSIPCTSVSEKEVVFGGIEKFKQIVSNSFRVMDADLFVALTGCTSDIVGDNIAEVVTKFKDEGKPIVYAETGGFKGNNFFGHELIIDSIIDQYLEETDEKEAGLVNVWATVPYQDTFWTGNFEELRKLLSALGVKVNIIFGPGNGIKSLKKVPKAQYNLLISPWVGLNNVKHLEKKFGTPYLHYPILPIGPTETAKFLRTVANFIGIDKKIVESEIKRQEDRYYYYIERAADILLETRILPKHFVTIADGFYSLGISRFLVNDLGLLPEKQFVTDNTPKKYMKAIEDEFKKYVNGIKAEVEFTIDSGVPIKYLREKKFRSKPLILGSAWDRVISKEIDAYRVSISTPISDRMVLSRTYVGYEGGLRLTEDIYSAVLDDFQ